MTSVIYPLDRVGQVRCSPRSLPTLPYIVFLCFAFSGRGADGANLFSSVQLMSVLSELLERGLLEWKGGGRERREKRFASLRPGTGMGMSWTAGLTSGPMATFNFTS